MVISVWSLYNFIASSSLGGCGFLVEILSSAMRLGCFFKVLYNKFSDLQFTITLFIVGVVGFNKRVWVFYFNK